MGDVWDSAFDRDRRVFAPLRAAMEPFRRHTRWPSLDDWNAHLPPSLTSASGAPIRFVEMPKRSRRRRGVDIERLYDERIFARGEVQSRLESWHDFFNMLVWVSFPNAKRAVNARQRAALRERVHPTMRTLPPARSPEQDALAMLDEGGLLIAARAGGTALDEALDRGDVASVHAAIERGDARALLFGHAIYEHLVVGTGEVRAFVQRVDVHSLEGDVQPEVDRALARVLEQRAPWSRAKALPVDERLFV